MHNQLADHGIVVGRHGVAGLHMRIEPHTQTAGVIHPHNGTWAGSETMVGIFGIDTAFHGYPAGLDLLLLKGQRFTGGNADL